MTTDEITEAARSLAEQLTADIQLAKTRDEHIRLTIRANSALALANGLAEPRNEAVPA
jgi:hypothetical protein